MYFTVQILFCIIQLKKYYIAYEFVLFNIPKLHAFIKELSYTSRMQG